MGLKMLGISNISDFSPKPQVNSSSEFPRFYAVNVGSA